MEEKVAPYIAVVNGLYALIAQTPEGAQMPLYMAIEQVCDAVFYSMGEEAFEYLCESCPEIGKK